MSVFFTEICSAWSFHRVHRAQVMQVLVEEKLGFLTVQTLETLAVEDWRLFGSCGLLLVCGT